MVDKELEESLLKDRSIGYLDLDWTILQEFGVWVTVWVNEEERICPLLSNRPFNIESEELTIRASFLTSSGTTLRGAVSVWTHDYSVSLLMLFFEQTRFLFGRSSAEVNLQRLSSLIGAGTDSIFPVHFTTDVDDRSGRKFKGAFAPDSYYTGLY